MIDPPRSLDLPVSPREEHPFQQRIPRAIRQAQACYTLFPPPQPDRPPAPVTVGVSGGGDSVCLLHALVQLQEALHIRLHVAHLDHSLRPESREEVAFVARLAQGWGLPFHSRRLPPGALEGPGLNLEEAARRARYTFLWEVAQEIAPADQEPILALAHTQDDQAETVLMRLLRGSGLEGLGGMGWVTRLAPPDPRLALSQEGRPGARPVRLVRPLLQVSREQIRGYLAETGLPWREDPSNRDLRFLRNRLRHQILPQLAAINPRIRESLAQTGFILAGEAARSASLDRAALERVLHEPPQPGQRVVLEVEALEELDVATQRGVLRRALRLALAGEGEGSGEEALFRPPFRPIEELRCRLRTGKRASGPHPLLGPVAWTLAPPLLSLHREDVLPFQPRRPFLDAAWRQRHPTVAIPVPGVLSVDGWRLEAQLLSPEQLPPDWRSGEDPWQAFLDADQVRQPVLTTPRPGMKFAPLGMGGRRRALGDLFTDRKIPPALRPGWPLVLDQATEQLLWVCGLQPSHLARITPQTTRVLWLRWVREGDGQQTGDRGQGRNGDKAKGFRSRGQIKGPDEGTR